MLERGRPLPTETEDQRYPIGNFAKPASVDPEKRSLSIATIAALPTSLREAVDGWSPQQLDTPYRDGGWTVRKLIHHIADSHMNAVLRVRLALTEDWPIILPYKEAEWAELGDAGAPVDWSLDIIENVHARWVMLLNSLDEAQWQRGFKHPERGPSTIEVATLLYEWHSKHHLAHITGLKHRRGW